MPFLENDFPSRGENDKDFQLHEIDDPDNTPTNAIEGNTDLSQHFLNVYWATKKM